MENPQAVKPEIKNNKTIKLYDIRIITIIFLVIISALFLFLFFITNYRTTEFDYYNWQNQNPNAQNDKNSMLNMKKSFLNSKNLTNIIIGTALDIVPENEINPDFGSVAYNFAFFGLELSELQHAKLIKFMYPHQEFSGDFPSINETSVWTASMPSDGEMFLAKKGYLCSTPPNYGPSLCASDGSSCIYPEFKGIKCAYIKNPSENNINKFSGFIKETLNDAKVYCNGECAIKETGEDEVVIRDYSKKIIYFEDINSTDTNNKEIVKQEVNKVLNYFKEAGWIASELDITDLEMGWDKDVISSIQISATNNKFNCKHTITSSYIWNKKESNSARKRDLIECSIHPSQIGQIPIE